MATCLPIYPRGFLLIFAILVSEKCQKRRGRNLRMFGPLRQSNVGQAQNKVSCHDQEVRNYYQNKDTEKHYSKILISIQAPLKRNPFRRRPSVPRFLTTLRRAFRRRWVQVERTVESSKREFLIKRINFQLGKNRGVVLILYSTREMSGGERAKFSARDRRKNLWNSDEIRHQKVDAVSPRERRMGKPGLNKHRYQIRCFSIR